MRRLAEHSRSNWKCEEGVGSPAVRLVTTGLLLRFHSTPHYRQQRLHLPPDVQPARCEQLKRQAIFKSLEEMSRSAAPRARVSLNLHTVCMPSQVVVRPCRGIET